MNSNIQKEKILVVDDDDNWLQTIALILGQAYELNLTTDPSRALALAGLHSFSVAILDQRLSSQQTGIDLLHQLRTMQPYMRGIILTGYPDTEDVVKSMKAGAFDYIEKGRIDLMNELPIRVQKALSESPLSSFAGMIARGESATLEFKSSVRWDIRLNKLNRELEGVVVRTVAGFLNSELGGMVLIGINDRGKILGLQHDYKTLKRQDRDGFETFLTALLLDAYGKDISPLIRIAFQEIEDNDVCGILAKPAPKVVFARDSAGGEHIYVRTGNSTRQLSTREAIEYCKMRWK